MMRDSTRRIAESVTPLLDQIDSEIAADYARTFEHCARLDFTRADPRRETRKAWDDHYERTRVLRYTRARIIEMACMVIEDMSELPVIVTYHGVPVHP